MLEEASIIAASGNPLGDRNIEVEIRRGTLQLRPGDLFVVFTDGVVERANRAGKLFGDRRLRSALTGQPLPDASALVALRDRVLARARSPRRRPGRRGRHHVRAVSVRSARATRLGNRAGRSVKLALLTLTLVLAAAPALAQRPNQGDDESAAFVDEGRTALKKGELDDAAKALDQAIALNPRRVEAYVLRSAVYAAKKQYKEGVALMRRAQALAPTDRTC